MTSPHVFIVAIENSADQLGAGLIKALRSKAPNLHFSAIGGRATENCGIKSQINIDGLSILGFSEALKAYPLVLKRVKETVAAVLSSKADAVVLIDSWGFMIRVAQRLKRAGYEGTVIKYVAPQVWAMREGRAKVLANAVDHLLTIHNFDAPYFEQHGLAVTHVGNPMFDTDFGSGDAERIRTHLSLSPDEKVCAVLFGSRQSELSQLRGPITAAVNSLKARYPEIVFISPVSETLRGALMPETESCDIVNVQLLEENWKYDVFAAAEVGIACSGTVTTQLACVGIPAVVVYKVNPLTWWVGKKLYKPDFISLINISAGRALMPELLQNQANGDAIALALQPYIEDKNMREKSSQELRMQAQVMRGEGGSASDSAAEKILEILSV